MAQSRQENLDIIQHNFELMGEIVRDAVRRLLIEEKKSLEEKLKLHGPRIEPLSGRLDNLWNALGLFFGVRKMKDMRAGLEVGFAVSGAILVLGGAALFIFTAGVASWLGLGLIGLGFAAGLVVAGCAIAELIQNAQNDKYDALFSKLQAVGDKLEQLDKLEAAQTTVDTDSAASAPGRFFALADEEVTVDDLAEQFGMQLSQ